MPDQLWDMIEGKELFQHIHDQQGCYNAKLHIAEMTALLGPPPQRSYKGINTCETTRGWNLSDEKTTEYARPRRCTSVGHSLTIKVLLGFLSRVDYSQTHETS